jgi:hypothetical protein
MPPRSPSPTKRSFKAASANPAADVDPRWLLKAGALTVLAAFVCGYLTLCLLFYQGQWQLVLHPKRTAISQPPVKEGAAELVHFAPGESATPQLTGWWIPAPAGSRYTPATILLLRSGDGSLAEDSHLLTTLHVLGIDIFAFDYRGYGQSADVHPNQARMTEDANSAWQYLRTIRNLSDRQILPYGIGVGASLATQLAAAHPDIPALILNDPLPDLASSVRTDSRTRLVPISLLFHDRFELTPLTTLRTPKLFLLTERTAKDQPADLSALKALVNNASSPKTTVSLRPSDFAGAIYREQMTTFLDEHLAPAPGPILTLPMSPPTSPPGSVVFIP